MNWITKLAPKIKSILGGKKSLKVADNSWVKCSQCQTMLYSDDLEKNYYVCPNCDLHLYIHPRTRMKNLFDEGIYEEIPYPTVQLDPLNFKDTNSYKEKFKEAQAKTEMQDAFLIGYGKMKGISTTVVAMNFKFMGGSLSSAGAEAMVKAAEHAITYNTPFIMITSSGGARMQENQLSLQALPKTTIAVQMVKDAKLPCSATKEFYTVAADQRWVNCTVTQSSTEETNPDFVNTIYEDLHCQRSRFGKA